jgi:Uma2 family endonuclease
MTTISLNLNTVNLTEEQFYNLCRVNETWQIEYTAQGELVIMTPVGSLGGSREADLITVLGIWNKQTQLGVVFSSATIFSLPNGGKRSPDVAWIKRERWEALSLEEQEGFAPICPDFVIELRSKSDSLTILQAKMEEYLDAGIRLGWLINPQQQEVYIYRPEQEVEVVKLPATLLGEGVLPGFYLELERFI